MIRSFLDGRFENTAFCVLSPDGSERLSRSGRAPTHVFRSRRGRRGGDSGADTIAAMEKIASEYSPRGQSDAPIVQDFHSFRQALNVAAGDQRLLLFVSAAGADQAAIRKTLGPVMDNAKIVGRFHVDFVAEQGDEKWQESISGLDADSQAGLHIIRADKFGQQGAVLKQLPGTASEAEIKSALLQANELFASDEQRKVYADHVTAGRKEKIHFEGGVEYGEDRDGDGEIDRRRGRGKSRGR